MDATPYQSGGAGTGFIGPVTYRNTYSTPIPPSQQAELHPAAQTPAPQIYTPVATNTIQQIIAPSYQQASVPVGYSSYNVGTGAFVPETSYSYGKPQVEPTKTPIAYGEISVQPQSYPTRSDIAPNFSPNFGAGPTISSLQFQGTTNAPAQLEGQTFMGLLQSGRGYQLQAAEFNNQFLKGTPTFVQEIPFRAAGYLAGGALVTFGTAISFKEKPVETTMSLLNPQSYVDFAVDIGKGFISNEPFVQGTSGGKVLGTYAVGKVAEPITSPIGSMAKPYIDVGASYVKTAGGKVYGFLTEVSLIPKEVSPSQFVMVTKKPLYDQPTQYITTVGELREARVRLRNAEPIDIAPEAFRMFEERPTQRNPTFEPPTFASTPKERVTPGTGELQPSIMNQMFGQTKTSPIYNAPTFAQKESFKVLGNNVVSGADFKFEKALAASRGGPREITPQSMRMFGDIIVSPIYDAPKFSSIEKATPRPTESGVTLEAMNLVFGKDFSNPLFEPPTFTVKPSGYRMLGGNLVSNLEFKQARRAAGKLGGPGEVIPQSLSIFTPRETKAVRIPLFGEGLLVNFAKDARASFGKIKGALLPESLNFFKPRELKGDTAPEFTVKPQYKISSFNPKDVQPKPRSLTLEKLVEKPKATLNIFGEEKPKTSEVGKGEVQIQLTKEVAITKEAIKTAKPKTIKPITYDYGYLTKPKQPARIYEYEYATKEPTPPGNEFPIPIMTTITRQVATPIANIKPAITSTRITQLPTIQATRQTNVTILQNKLITTPRTSTLTQHQTNITQATRQTIRQATSQTTQHATTTQTLTRTITRDLFGQPLINQLRTPTRTETSFKTEIPTEPIAIPNQTIYSQEKRRKKLEKVFNVEVRRRGKFREFAGGLTFGEGITQGVAAVKGSIAATFRLKPAGFREIENEGAYRTPNQKEFYRPKRTVDTFTQRRGFRLGGLGERLDIQAARKQKGFRFL